MQELDRMEGTFEVEEVGPAEFTVTNLRIVPETVELGGNVFFHVTVTNIGGTADTHRVYLTGDFERSVETAMLSPGQSQDVSVYVTPPAAGTYYIEFGGLTGSFTVTAVAVPQGHILGIMVKKAGGDWQQLGTVKLILSETIQLSVSWANDSMTHSLKGHIALRLVKPGLLEYWPVPVSGQDTIVAPSGSSYVLYEIPLDQLGTWRHYEILSGAIA